MNKSKKIRRVYTKQNCFNVVKNKVDLINSLDDYSLAHIFMMLPIAERFSMDEVCQKWKEASKLAWCDIKKYKCCDSIGHTYNNQLMTQSYLEKLLLRCGAYLRELSLSKIFDSCILKAISERCKNLAKLEIVIDEGLKNDANDYIRAFETLDKLKSIKIHILLDQISDEMNFQINIMNFLPEEINEIHLDVSYKFDYLIPWSMLTSRREFDILISFNLKKFKNLQSLTLIGFKLNNIVQQISELTTLVHLDLENSRVTDECSYKGADIYKRLVNLEYVHNFGSSSTYNSNIPITIFNTCKNIKVYKEPLCMNRSSVNVNLFKNLMNFKNIDYLKIYWVINDDFAIKMINYFQSLKYLDLSGDIDRSRLPLTALQLLTKLENLECLKLPYMILNDESIIAITTNCKKLKELKISKCLTQRINLKRISPAVVFDGISNLEYLECLDVSGTVEFQNRNLIAVAKKCKNLRDLNIRRCRYITERGLTSVTKFKKLEKLNISDINDVTNKFIVKLKGLKCFNVHSCKKLIDSGIIKLLENCPDLEYLNLSKTNITTDIISAIDNATKNRTNGIILKIVMSFDNPLQASVISENFKWLNFIPDGV